MSTVATLGVDITASTRGYEKAMRTVRQKTEQVSQQLGAIGRRMSVAVTLPILGVGTAAIKSASDAEETAAKFDTVFGDMAGSVRGWAETHAEEVNRSSRAFEGYLSSLQDTFVPMGIARDEAAEMSKVLTELAVDLASFNNESESQAVQRLQSAIVGNSEAVRAYGINLTQAALEQELLNMGIQGGVREASEQQKVLARMNLILANTQDAQGDAARTSGSFANQMRGLRSDINDVSVIIGEELIPKAEAGVGKLKEFAEAFKALDEETQGLIVDIGLVTAAIGPLLVGLSAVIKSIGTVASTVKVAAGFVLSLKGALAGIALATVGSISEATGLTDFTIIGREAVGIAQELGDEVRELVEGGRDMEGLADTQKSVTDAIRETSAAYRENRERVAEMERVIETLDGARRESARQAIQDLEAEGDRLLGQVQQLGSLAQMLQNVQQQWADTGDAASGAGDDAAAAAETMLQALRRIQTEFSIDFAADAPEDLDIGDSEALDFSFGDRIGSVKEAQDEVLAAERAFNNAQTEEQRRAAANRKDLWERELENRRAFMTEEQVLQQQRLERQRKYSEMIANTVTSGMRRAAEGFLDGIGRMAAGQATLGNVMRGVLDTLLQAMQRVGKIVMAAGGALEALRNALKNPFGGNPLAAVAAGAALIAIAGAARAALSSVGSGGSAGDAAGGADFGQRGGGGQRQLVARVQGRDLLFLIEEERQARAR
jgi:hypothetical protein